MPQRPKHPSLRARRNTVSTATELVVVPRDEIEIPDPPPHYRIITKKEDPDRAGERVEAEWHPNALQTWVEIHESPMMAEILEADLGAIRILMGLEHEFWTKLESGGSVFALADSIARYRRDFGLAPMGRRSLQWVTAQTAETVGRLNRTPRRPPAIEGTAVELPSGPPDADLLGALE